jgi:hypothetical protein
MGVEVTTKVTIGSKRTEAKVLLETAEVIIRGRERLRIPFSQIKSLAVNSGTLSFFFNGQAVSIFLGEKSAKWFEKIKNPKSVIDKLGVQSGSRVSIINVGDKKFLTDIKGKTDDISIGSPATDSDFIFYEANSPVEVAHLAYLKKYLKPSGGIWVVSRKGKNATMKDVEVMSIGKKCGLVDVTVVGFSETHTALKFVIPISRR